ncbi:MAG: DUF2461 domain-containing protein [Massilioclostridium sp.]|nr:DUF2461 domain-containing protein [Massilioclostridium sp.]MEE1491383.1 DUF2461 domain-containing protein [Massilioclostridium sp.]
MPISAKTLDFLFENKLNNSKEWYHAHKKEYTELVLRPLAELVVKLKPTMLELDPDLIVEPRVTRSISRIYRDTRFSKDKSLYRDNMWLIFIRDKKLYEGPPGFYVDISPRGLSYGMGYYQASADAMRCYREMILGREPAFLKALEAYEGQKVFSLTGDLYKRSKAPDEPERIRSWVDRKSVDFDCTTTDFNLMFSENLDQVVAQHFRLLKPVYEFLMAVETRRDHTPPGSRWAGAGAPESK